MNLVDLNNRVCKQERAPQTGHAFLLPSFTEVTCFLLFNLLSSPTSTFTSEVLSTIGVQEASALATISQRSFLPGIISKIDDACP